MSNRKGFTQLDNSFIDDDSLSAKAKMIYLYLLSRGGDTRSSVADITSRMKDGKASIQTGVQELIDANLLSRSSFFDKKSGKKYSHYHCVRTTLKAFKLPRQTQDKPTLKPFKFDLKPMPPDDQNHC